MSITRWLTTPRQRQMQVQSPMAPPSHLEAVTWAHLIGDQTDTIPEIITREIALTVPAVARARSAICGIIARTPLRAHTPDGPLTPQPHIISMPDPTRTRTSLLTWLADQLLMHGGAYLWDPTGTVPATVLTPVDHTRVTVTDTGTVLIDGQQPPGTVIWVDGPGDGLLHTGRETIRAAISIARAAARAAANPVPSLALTQTSQLNLTRDKIDAMLATWTRARRSPDGGVGFVPYGLSAVPLGQSDSQLMIDARREIAIDIARHAGIPSWAVDAGDGSGTITYSNVQGRLGELIELGVSPYLQAISERLSRPDILPEGVWAEFDTAYLLRGNLSDRSAAYSAAQAAGIMTSQDCIDMERGL